jgi:hypothetical protein
MPDGNDARVRYSIVVSCAEADSLSPPVLTPAATVAANSLAQLATLDAGPPQKLAVLLLGHTLAALLDDRAHA